MKNGKEHYENWTIEYQPEVGKWELMEGAAHRGLFPSPDAARLAMARAGGPDYINTPVEPL